MTIAAATAHSSGRLATLTAQRAVSGIRTGLAATPSGRFVLRVENGAGARQLTITRPCATVGRDPGNDIVLEVPGVATRQFPKIP